MSFERQAEEGMTVLGIFVRASNEMPELIGDLWRRFHAMDDAEGIPGRRNDTVYCVYCEYEGDATQAYTVVLGCEVAKDAAVPERMRKVSIAAGDFAVFPVAMEGPLPVFRVWKQIWDTPLERRYEADYDQYAKDSVTIHVGVQ